MYIRHSLKLLALSCWLLSTMMSSAKGFSATPYKAEWIDMLSSSSSTKPNQVTPPRSGHTSFRVGNDVYVFGGYVEEEASDEGGMPSRHVVNDLWKWDKTKGWIQQETSGENKVNPRLALASATVSKTPTLFGGWDPQTAGTGGIMLDDIVQLDTATNTWRVLDDVKLPDGPTSRHVAASLGDGRRVLIHTHRCLDHVIIFEQDEDGEAKIYKQPTTGQAPSARGLHAATMLPNSSKFLVTCGAAQDGSMSNEVFVLDTDTWKWTTVDMASEEAPCPRASPCICALDSNSAVVFGGAARTDEGGLKGCNDLWLLTLDGDDKGRWELLLKDGPPARNAATMDPIDPPPGGKKKGQYFLLHGGWEPFQKTWNDNHVLRVYKS